MKEIKTCEEYAKLCKEDESDVFRSVERLKHFYACFLAHNVYTGIYDVRSLLVGADLIFTFPIYYDAANKRLVFRDFDCCINMKDVPAILEIESSERDNKNVVEYDGGRIVFVQV